MCVGVCADMQVCVGVYAGLCALEAAMKKRRYRSAAKKRKL